MIQPGFNLDPATVALLKSDPQALRQFYDSLTPEQRAAYAPLPSSSSVGDDGSISVSYGVPPQPPAPLTLASPVSAAGDPALGNNSSPGAPTGALDFSQFVPPEKRADYQAFANGLAPASAPAAVQPVPYGNSAGASARTPASDLDFSIFVPPENLAAYQATNSGATPQASDAQAAPAPFLPSPQPDFPFSVSSDGDSSSAVPQQQMLSQAMQQRKLRRLFNSLIGGSQPPASGVDTASTFPTDGNSASATPQQRLNQAMQQWKLGRIANALSASSQLQASGAQVAPTPFALSPQPVSTPSAPADGTSVFAIRQQQMLGQAMQKWKLCRIANALIGSYQLAAPAPPSSPAVSPVPKASTDLTNLLQPENLAAFKAAISGTVQQASDANAATAASVPNPQAMPPPSLSTDAKSASATSQSQRFDQAMQQWKLGRIGNALIGSYQLPVLDTQAASLNTNFTLNGYTPQTPLLDPLLNKNPSLSALPNPAFEHPGIPREGQAALDDDGAGSHYLNDQSWKGNASGETDANGKIVPRFKDDGTLNPNALYPLDPDKDAWIVAPINLASANGGPLQVGDWALVTLRDGTTVPAQIGDFGPPGKNGEMSPVVAKALGLNVTNNTRSKKGPQVSSPDYPGGADIPVSVIYYPNTH